MSDGYIYLASPYSVKYPLSQHQAQMLRMKRYEKVCKMAAELMKNGENVFCPIAHSHPIETIGMPGELHGQDFWLKQDFAVLRHAKELVVFQMDGWEQSSGVKAEIDFAKEHDIPIRYIENKVFKRVSNRWPSTARKSVASHSETARKAA